LSENDRYREDHRPEKGKNSSELGHGTSGVIQPEEGGKRKKP
jgi:hypothetical protein